jgi:hypothetical protein
MRRSWPELAFELANLKRVLALPLRGRTPNGSRSVGPSGRLITEPPAGQHFARPSLRALSLMGVDHLVR